LFTVISRIIEGGVRNSPAGGDMDSSFVLNEIESSPLV